MFLPFRRLQQIGAQKVRSRFVRAGLGVSVAVVLTGTLAACGNQQGDIVVEEGVGIAAVRSPCPTVAVPEYTGDITLFTDPARTDSGALDVVATITNVRSTCTEGSDTLNTQTEFELQARRYNTNGARTVQLPYFSTVMRGGTAVIAKRVGTVTVTFADGQERASVKAQASSMVDRASATLPADVRARLTRKRKAGDEDAAIDPLSIPEVRDAIARASFEHLIGFQLTDKQLAYNATR